MAFIPESQISPHAVERTPVVAPITNIVHEQNPATAKSTASGVIALFNASDDTVDMVKKVLLDSATGQSLILCHFADLKNGIVNFDKYLERYNPEVVIFDISPPYDENWAFFKTMRDHSAMHGRGTVLTTTNKVQLDEVLKEDSHALEIVGKRADRDLIKAAIRRETTRATTARQGTVVALVNASSDTVEMVERMLTASGNYRLATACHFADLRKGNVDFPAYLATQNPSVVIFDISPPYEENWKFFKTMRDSKAMKKRAYVLTTTNKLRLDEIVGNDSAAIEIVGKPYDLKEITSAIEKALSDAEASAI